MSALVPSFTPAAAVSDVKFEFKNNFEYITQIALSLKTLLVSALVSSFTPAGTASEKVLNDTRWDKLNPFGWSKEKVRYHLRETEPL